MEEMGVGFWVEVFGDIEHIEDFVFGVLGDSE